MKLLFLVALVAGVALADKDMMLQKNRIPVDAVGSVGSACDQCESLVKRFVEAAKDPKKMRELKMLLNVLCHETSYVDECRVFVNNIDSLIQKLEPYLEDTKRVCRSIHMCSNKKLDAFRRIGMLYVKRTMDKVEGMKDLVCDECQLAANEIKALVDDKEKQQEVRDFISKEICVHAGSYRGMCDMFVEQFLPEIFQELDLILKDTKKACADLGFCDAIRPPGKMSLVSTTNDEHPMLSFWRGAKSVQTSKGPEVLMSCLECRIAADEFLNELELKRDATAKDIQGLVCDHVLPKNFTASCQDFLSMYLPTVLYMTYKQYTGVGICDKIHCCDQASLKAMAQISMSEQKTLAVHSCSALQSYVKENVHSAMMRVNGIAMAQETFCQPIPGFLQPLCYSTMERMVPSLLTKLAVVAGEGRFCSKN